MANNPFVPSALGGKAPPPKEPALAKGDKDPVDRVKVEQIKIADSDTYTLRNSGLTPDQANRVRDYARHIAAHNSVASRMGVKEATAYAMKLLDWAKEYAMAAARVRGTDMTKAYLHIMRHL